MTPFRFFLFLLLVQYLCSCGKEVPAPKPCINTWSNTKVLNLGLLEKIDCGPGEVITSILPKYIGSGIVTHLEVQCAKVTISCP